MPSSSLTSSIGVRPGTRSDPSGEVLHRRLVGVVLVGDLAHDLLEQVLERDETGGAAVLVEDDRHVELLRAHLAQQLGHPLLLGHEHRWPHRLAHRVVDFACPCPADEVLEVDEPDDVVGAPLARGEPREAVVDRALDRGFDRVVDLHRDDVGAGQHHLAHDRVAELEDRVDELALLARDGVLVGGDVGHRADLFLGDVRALLEPLAREHDVGDADEPAREHSQRCEVA